MNPVLEQAPLGLDRHEPEIDYVWLACGDESQEFIKWLHVRLNERSAYFETEAAAKAHGTLTKRARLSVALRVSKALGYKSAHLLDRSLTEIRTWEL